MRKIVLSIDLFGDKLLGMLYNLCEIRQSLKFTLQHYSNYKYMIIICSCVLKAVRTTNICYMQLVLRNLLFMLERVVREVEEKEGRVFLFLYTSTLSTQPPPTKTYVKSSALCVQLSSPTGLWGATIHQKV